MSFYSVQDMLIAKESKAQKLTGKTEEEREEYVEREWADWVWRNIDGRFSKVENENARIEN